MNDLTKKNLLSVDDFSFWYGETQALCNINLEIPEKQVTAFIGPSGCGKSTLLRSFNRMNDLAENTRHEGEITLDGKSIFSSEQETISLRKQMGMVFQKYNPFAKSIYENVAFPLRVSGVKDKKFLNEIVEHSLKQAQLWEEVKDRLNDSAYALSGGQMQRLCIARAVSNRPKVLLMDEPCAALDPTSTLKIEELIHYLKKEFTIVIVTHNLQQGSRCSDQTAFLYRGEIIEQGKTSQIYQNPKEQKTLDYITGRFG